MRKSAGYNAAKAQIDGTVALCIVAIISAAILPPKKARKAIKLLELL